MWKEEKIKGNKIQKEKDVKKERGRKSTYGRAQEILTKCVQRLLGVVLCPSHAEDGFLRQLQLFLLYHCHRGAEGSELPQDTPTLGGGEKREGGTEIGRKNGRGEKREGREGRRERGRAE